MFPQLNIRMGRAFVFVLKAKRGAVFVYRQDGTRGKICANTDDVAWIDAADNLGNRMREHVKIILRMLERPVVAKRRSVGKGFVHHGMRIFVNCGSEFFAGFHIHEHSASGQRAVINTNRIFTHNFTS